MLGIQHPVCHGAHECRRQLDMCSIAKQHVLDNHTLQFCVRMHNAFKQQRSGVPLMPSGARQACREHALLQPRLTLH